MLKITLTIISFLPAIVFSLPENAVVNNGQVSFQQNNNVLNIHQQSNLASINYSSFNIQRNEIVNFIQPSSSAIALNRVSGNNSSQIFGQMNANGQVFLINPNGILFAPGSSVNVSGLFATTLSISDNDFFNRKFSFDNQGGFASIINYGVIQGNYIALVSPRIDNYGDIVAEMGKVHLHAADAVDVSFSDGINIETTSASYDAIINNHGTIAADGGQVVLNAAARNELIETVINNNGVIRAKGIKQSEGRIFLVAEQQGDIVNTGEINASASEQNINGGEIKLTGQRIAQLGDVHADGMGTANGGTIHIKADKVVALGEQSITTANAGKNGAGGKVIALSPDTTLFRSGANIEAKGGSVSGDGGYIDVSGYKHVEAEGDVNVSATKGTHGTFLVDPEDILISSAAHSGVTPVSPFQANASGTSVLNITTLNGALTAGANVEVRTDVDFADGDVGNITIDTGVVIDYDTNDGGSLLLFADGSIIFNDNSQIVDLTPGTADSMNITFFAGGDITFGDNTLIQTNGGNFISTSGGSTRVLPASVGGNSLIDSGTGTLSITTGGNFRLGGLLSDNATSSAITLNIAGDITDGGDTYTDISAVNGRTTITAEGTSALETNLSEVVFDFTLVSADIINNGAIDIIGGRSVGDLSISTLVGDITILGDIDLDGSDGSTYTLTSANDIIFASNSIIEDSNTATADNTNLTLSAVNNITMQDSSNRITVGSGIVSITADSDGDRVGDAVLSRITTTSSATNAITIMAENMTDPSNNSSDLSAVNGRVNIIASGDVQGGNNGNIDLNAAQLSLTMVNNGNANIKNSNGNLELISASGVNDFILEVGGVLTMQDAGLSVTGNATIIAVDMVDNGATPRDVVINAQALDLNLSAPVGDVALTTNINSLIATLAGVNRNLSVTETNSLSITQLNGINDFLLNASAGNVTVPDAGLSVSGNMNITTQNIFDSDFTLNLSATDAALVITAATNDLTINSDFDRLDASIVGGGLSINEANSLQIENFDATNATAINIVDGNFTVRVQTGDLTINDTVQAQDATADGIRSGMIDLQVDSGDLLIGNTGATSILSNNTVDQTASGGLNGNQESIRIHNPDTADINSNIIIGNGVGNDVQITAEGGDVFIKNESSIILSSANNRNITLHSDVTIDAYNLITDSLTGTIVVDADVINNGMTNIRSGRSLVIESTIVNVPAIPVIPLTPVIPDILIDVVESINNQVSAITQNLEVSTNSESLISNTISESQLVFNQVFNACDSVNSSDQQIKCSQENAMQGFLNSLLIGGNLPEIKSDEE